MKNGISAALDIEAAGTPFTRIDVLPSEGPWALSILRTLTTPTTPFSSQYTMRIIHTFQPKKSTPTSGTRFAAMSVTTAQTDDVTRYQAIRRSTPGWYGTAGSRRLGGWSGAVLAAPDVVGRCAARRPATRPRGFGPAPIPR